MILSILLVSLSGCKEYLDVVPEGDIQSIESIFETKSGAETWLETCYSFLQPLGSFIKNPAMTGADEFIASDYVRYNYFSSDYRPVGFYIGDGLQSTQEPYGDLWSDTKLWAGIRYCNTFLNYIWDVQNFKDHEKRLREGEIKALKAYMYFELVRQYGPIVLVDENLDPNRPSSELKKVRRPIEECFKAIDDLLVEAIEVLPSMKNKEYDRLNYFCLESAMALRARVLLYAASPLFNNANDMYRNFKNKNGEALFPETYDKEKWKLAADVAIAAIEVCETNGLALLSGSNSKTTKLLNTMNDIQYSSLSNSYTNSEVLFRIKVATNDQSCSYLLPYLGMAGDAEFRNGTAGVGASMKMVEMYYTVNGLPMEADKSWPRNAKYALSQEISPEYKDVVMQDGTQIINLHLRREPRFYAHIAADRCYWMQGTSAAYNHEVLAHRKERFGIQVSTLSSSIPQNVSGYWVKKSLFPNKRILGYSAHGYDEPTVVMRVAELYLIAAEALNEYYGPAKSAETFKYLNVVRERAGIPDVETSWNVYSDVLNKLTTQLGIRDVIQREWNVEFAFEGHRFWNLRRWMTAGEILNDNLKGWNVLGTEDRTFYNGFIGPVDVWTKREFISPRDYFFPIRTEEIIKASIVQNPGWGGK